MHPNVLDASEIGSLGWRTNDNAGIHAPRIRSSAELGPILHEHSEGDGVTGDLSSKVCGCSNCAGSNHFVHRLQWFDSGNAALF